MLNLYQCMVRCQVLSKVPANWAPGYPRAGYFTTLDSRDDSGSG
jgi:hypothetical protein